MSDVQIKALRNGPLEVSGQVNVSDSAGVQRPVDEDPIYLSVRSLGQQALHPGPQEGRLPGDVPAWRPVCRPRQIAVVVELPSGDL
jgi:hypothetical protein